MAYSEQSYEHLKGISGLSNEILGNHFALYKGYVASVNNLSEKISQIIREEKGAEIEFAEMKRRFGWEFNGMRLHEYYFDNITKESSKIDEGSLLFKKIEKDFGSYAAWEAEFKALGAMRGIGWAGLYYDRKGDRMINLWINEHDAGHAVGEPILLVMDLFEHAYMLDYGTKKVDYIEAFMKMIAWGEVEKRYLGALKNG